jgi:hypothetical protein
VLRIVLAILAGLGMASAQQQPPPKVKVNMLNVCSPSAEEQQEIAAALAKVPKQPLFSPDFEVARGRTSMEERPSFLQAGESAQFSSETPAATWVRIRHEFSVQAMFSTVQYSFSVDPKTMMETMVFRVRDPKELMQLAIEDSASAITSATAMLGSSTPASRIKLERFGKSSVVLARCQATENAPAPDQSAYEPLFQRATEIITNYRELLAVKRTVPDELARITGHSAPQKSKHIARPTLK